MLSMWFFLGSVFTSAPAAWAASDRATARRELRRCKRSFEVRLRIEHPAFARALSAAQAHWQPGAVELVPFWSWASPAQLRADQPEQAEDTFREGPASIDETTSPEAIAALHGGVGDALLAQGRPEALPRFDDALVRLTDVLGEEHVDIAFLLADRADLLGQGRPDDAIHTLETLLRDESDTLSSQSEAWLLTELASMQVDDGHWQIAEALAERVTSLQDADPVDVARSELVFAHVRFEEGQVEEALG